MPNFGIIRGRPQIGENRQPSALPSHYTLPANSILVPPEPPLERGKFLQALIDILCVIVLAFFLCVASACLPLAIFMLFVGSF